MILYKKCKKDLWVALDNLDSTHANFDSVNLKYEKKA
jgi:hypothetical protein